MHNPTLPSTSIQSQSQSQSPNPMIPESPMANFSFSNDPTCSSSLFNWSDFLDFDFDFDNPFSVVTFDSDQPTPAPEPEPVLTGTEDMSKIRKRDERLVCPNFVAGLIPCACPELDEILEKEEELMRGGTSGKKRARSLKASAGSKARCQVPECEADISELKGYHKRHRVCLGCAHASTVVLDGQDKRYCQQCGKFHILSDFDEGKRSCRRKLERHNNRRRRKPADGKGIGETESKPITLSEDVCEEKSSKDSLCLSSQNVDKEPLFESEGQVSRLGSAQDSDNIQGDGHGVQSRVAFDETQIIGKNENPKCNEPLFYDDKSAFSSVCTTGRISFKLYDWNPAEFPRRLRNQIFQWLSSMPVELEGYIRPGCTILTMFIAMPKITWSKLSEDPAVHLHDLVISHGNLLSGRADFLAYMNNMIFSIVQGTCRTSVIQLEVHKQAPKLHYVHPTCFEAGMPLEFVACGSNLLQRKFRFLLSFAGKYLTYDLSVLLSREYTEDNVNGLNHQLLKVSFSQKDLNLFGPAFVEVENESGLSNFIPILIANKDICSEMKKIEQRLIANPFSERHEVTSTSLCQLSVLKQTNFSELITEVAWSIKNPVLEYVLPWTRTRIENTNKLLNFLIESESTATLDRILYNLDTCMDNNLISEALDSGIERLRISMHKARLLINQKLHRKGDQVSKVIDVPWSDRRPELSSEMAPLLNKEKMMTTTTTTTIDVKERPLKSCTPLFTRTVCMSRPFVLLMAAATVCLGLCAAILHPQKARDLAVTIRECITT